MHATAFPPTAGISQTIQNHQQIIGPKLTAYKPPTENGNFCGFSRGRSFPQYILYLLALEYSVTFCGVHVAGGTVNVHTARCGCDVVRQWMNDGLLNTRWPFDRKLRIPYSGQRSASSPSWNPNLTESMGTLQLHCRWTTCDQCIVFTCSLRTDYHICMHRYTI
jgi:hypothetical protein